MRRLVAVYELRLALNINQSLELFHDCINNALEHSDKDQGETLCLLAAVLDNYSMNEGGKQQLGKGRLRLLRKAADLKQSSPVEAMDIWRAVIDLCMKHNLANELADYSSGLLAFLEGLSWQHVPGSAVLEIVAACWNGAEVVNAAEGAMTTKGKTIQSVLRDIARSLTQFIPEYKNLFNDIVMS